MEEFVKREKDLKTSRTQQAGEPASILLARIKEERAKKEAEGKVRKVSLRRTKRKAHKSKKY